MTPLSQEEVDALRVVLLDNGVKPGEVSLEDSQSTLEKVHQQLTETGYKELATNIRDKINKGTSLHIHVTGAGHIKALDVVPCLSGTHNRVTARNFVCWKAHPLNNYKSGL